MLATTESKVPEKLENALEELQVQAAPFIAALDSFFDSQVNELEPEIQELARYCFSKTGKRLRALLIFFSAWKGPPNDFQPELVKLAAIIEMVHLATLVHDDILDDASLRHNQATISELHGPAVAVLLGDALFSQALKLAAEFPTPIVCRKVAKATRRVCAGEISQTLRNTDILLSKEAYYRIIELKTAELFAVSCELGAYVGNFSEAFQNDAKIYGREIGTAYQIFDDLSDFLGRQDKIGKTLGTDLQKGKQTLPLLILIDSLQKDGREAETTALISGQMTHFDKVNQLLIQYDIPKKVTAEFQERLDKAQTILKKHDAVPCVEKLEFIALLIRNQIKNLEPSISVT